MSRIGLAAALALLVAAVPAGARFAPVPDARYWLTVAATRDDGREVRRTEAAYDVRFAPRPDGWRATLVQVSGGDAITAGFLGVPVEIDLDRRGRLSAVRDADGWWARLRTGIVAHAPAAARDAMLAAHDHAAPDARAAVLGGDLLALCAGDEAGRRPGERATTLPASDGTPLPARETVRRVGDGVAVAVAATGRIDGGRATATIARTRLVDRRTGLVREMEETRLIDAAGHRLRVAKIVRLAPPVS